ncbi:MAG TPA: hypothetical protein VFF73_19820, partial [Planctomycetota bacterium]|nr:hypothetical protein [Planctomycetota bacterium]
MLLLSALALAGDETARLRLQPARVTLELELSTTWRSSDYKLRSLDDTARLAASLDVTPTSGGIEAVATELAVTRRKRAHIAGVFSDDDRDAKGEARWKSGDSNAPPAWRMLLTDRGVATADVNSAAPIWHLEGWLQGFDRSADEDARLRRLIHY